jgi:acyl-CoA synthetase (AMP-forming)/AMP-acid ligase II
MTNPTLLDPLRELSRVTNRGITFYDPRGRAKQVSYAEMWRRALAFGGGLLRRGAQPGQAVVMVLPDPEEAIIAILGAMAVGCPPAPIYPPFSARAVPSFLRFLGHVATRAGAQIVVAGNQVYPFLGAVPRDVPTVRLVERAGALAGGPPAEPVRPAPDDVAFLQFTSGSTSAPKGVVVTHACLVANLAMIRAAARMDARSCVVTWLPVYHDMGLIGTVLNAVGMHLPLVVLAPRTFLRDPALWLETIARHRGTHTAAPNFAYGLCTKRVTDTSSIDLSSMQVFICGAEPIVPETLERFARHFAPAGLEPSALVPAYGLAEATLAVTFTPFGAGMQVDEIDAGALGEDRVAHPAARGSVLLRVPSCGVAMPGLEVRIGTESGEAGPAGLPDRVVGEIQVRGPSVTPGYVHDPDATCAARTVDGWLRTGDLGYLSGGRLYPCGRTKDVIILRGRNLHAHDIEALAGALPDVRTGNVVAFGSPDGKGDERLIVVAESRATERSAALEREIRGCVGDAFGVVPDAVVIVAPGTLPKTSSGKLRRAEARAKYAGGGLAPPRAAAGSLETVGVALRSGFGHVMNLLGAD